MFMFVLVSYDVTTKDADGKKRLRKIAKICQNYGQRVQNSVFECYLDYSQFLIVRAQLLTIMNTDEDSIRFYLLGNNPEKKVEHYGIKPSYSADDVFFV